MNKQHLLAVATIVACLAAGFVAARAIERIEMPVDLFPSDRTKPLRERADMALYPIRTSEMPMRVMAGDPRVRGSGRLLESEDGGGAAFVWECTPGTFIWRYGADEMIHFLEGHVIVKVNGATTEFRGGDLALFKAGTLAEWEIRETVRKIAFTRRPSIVGELTRKLKRLILSTS